MRTPAALFATLLTACAPAGGVQVQDAWAVAAPPSSTVSAVYFTVQNPGREPLVLSGVHTDAGGRASLMVTTRQGAGGAGSGGHGHHSDLLGMADVLQLTVPARRTHRFEPGGDHVMLTGLSGGLPVGETVNVTLRTAAGEELNFPATARLP